MWTEAAVDDDANGADGASVAEPDDLEPVRFEEAEVVHPTIAVAIAAAPRNAAKRRSHPTRRILRQTPCQPLATPLT